MKHLFLPFLLSMLLASCVSISVQAETQPAPYFVTSTLPSTKIVMPQPLFTSSPEPAKEEIIRATDLLCKNGAVLLEDVTFPDNSNVPAGKIFTKTWKLKNSGTCPWIGFTIHYASGEQMNAPASVPMPETPAGGTVDLSVDLTAPMRDGTYTTYFSLQNAAGELIPIGSEQNFYVTVNVGTKNAPVLAQSASSLPGASGLSFGTMTIYCKYNYSENAAYVGELASLINRARGNAGLSALSVSPLLTQAAQGHSIDMACNNFLGHQSSDGTAFGAVVRAVGYPTSFQEIIAIGTPQNALDQWHADSGHWEIVLNAFATEMGIGYAYNANSDYGGYFTVDLH